MRANEGIYDAQQHIEVPAGPVGQSDNDRLTTIALAGGSVSQRHERFQDLKPFSLSKFAGRGPLSFVRGDR